MHKITCDPKTQVSGATMLSILENSQSAEVFPLAKKHGFEIIDPAGWYSFQNFLNFVTDLSEHPNLMFNLIAMGMSIAEVALMPPSLAHAGFTQVIEGWDAHYQANFRNGDVGHKTTIRVGDHHYKVVLDQTVMPDDLEYGVLYGFAKRFLPPGTHFSVWFDEDEPHMDEGGSRTILHVSWD